MKVKVFTSLRQYIPSSDKHLDGDKWDVPNGAKIIDVLAMLKLPEDQELILLVNGRHADKDRVLGEGDVLHVFPPVIGG